jgi:methionine-S-sulfoxide reductase
VCSGRTGHAESVLVEYDPSKVTYEKLLNVFFEIHNPSRQCSPGEQYRSEIFTFSDEQSALAKHKIDAIGAGGTAVGTRVTKAGTFWMAEDYHQQYYGKHAGGACRIR